MDLNSKVSEILKIPKDKREEIDLRTKEVISDIDAGKTTGDRIRDFVIRTHGMIHPDLEIPYRKIARSAEANIGGQVMVVRENSSPRLDRMFHDVMFPNRKEIGILRGGVEFDLKKQNLVLPTDSYAEITDAYRDKWKLTEGPITIYWFDMFNFEKGDLLKGTQVYDVIVRYNLLDPKRNLKVLIGDEVEAHFRSDWSGRPKALNTDYVKALYVLGVPAPKDFKEKYDKEVLESKIHVISEIEKLCREEEKYTKEIRRVEGMVGESPFIETKTDAFFMTWGDRDKLDDVRRGIRRNLQKGLELKMHEDEMVLPWRQPGMSIDVREYITGLCGKYKVDIPDPKKDAVKAAG